MVNLASGLLAFGAVASIDYAGYFIFNYQEAPIIIIASGLLFVFFHFVFNYMFLLLGRLGRSMNRLLDSLSIETIAGGIFGLLIGVLLGLLVGIPFSDLKFVGAFLPVIILFLFSYYGMRIGTRRLGDLLRIFNFKKKPDKEEKKAPPLKAKVVDTSAIIDGRIYDVALSHFLEGVLIVPKFVIGELQYIADSEDSIRRSKGRRGLDLLAKIQNHADIQMEIVDDPILEEKEVDMKLVALCRKLGAPIITNDFNLNKVAQLHGIRVLNLNELTNAVKFNIYPGETMDVKIIKPGKEEDQGVSYLDDGTMVIVEDGQKFLGQTLKVVVARVFQTAAGRIIFARDGREAPQRTEGKNATLSSVSAGG
jgi:uncharacterized protein YacL